MNLDLSRMNSIVNILKPQKRTEEEILLENIKTARSDLERAESLFNELTDAAAMDYAIYSVLAARAKYSYLISLAKERHIKL